MLIKAIAITIKGGGLNSRLTENTISCMLANNPHPKKITLKAAGDSLN